jgi:hypothetical protein
MTEPEGTFSKLMEIADAEPKKARPIPTTPPNEPPNAEPHTQTEDLNTTPYISQNYRFTEDELRWLRTRSFDLSEVYGAKVPQNTILRIALHELRDACERNPNSNPLTRAVSRLKK